MYIDIKCWRLVRLTLDSVPIWYSYGKEVLGKEEEMIEKNS